MHSITEQNRRKTIPQTQRVTAADLTAGRIRIPRGRSKELFPDSPSEVTVVLKGTVLELRRYDPRFGPDQERSGVLRIPKDVLAELVAEDEVLLVRRSRDGTIYLGDRGSKLRIAQWVNKHQTELNRQLVGQSATLQDFLDGGSPDWRSPLLASDYREFSADLWSELELPDPDPYQDGFWPARQPHWDAIAVLPHAYGIKGVLLVEAKSHTDELASSCTATSAQSVQRIDTAMSAAQRYLGIDEPPDWKSPYYQAANRLTFLYYLRARRNIPAWLFFVYFTGDEFEVEGRLQPCPVDEAGWKAALDQMHRALALPDVHPLQPFAVDVFVAANPAQWR